MPSNTGTAIWVSYENKKRLANYGKAGESMNTAIGRVLDLAEATRECGGDGE